MHQRDVVCPTMTVEKRDDAMEGSGESHSAQRSTESSRKRWHASSANKWNRIAHPSSLPCPREQGRIARVMQSELTELNTRLTVLSIGGVGAFDVVQGGRGAVPSRAVAFREGVRHTIEQHEGGEQ